MSAPNIGGVHVFDLIDMSIITRNKIHIWPKGYKKDPRLVSFYEIISIPLPMPLTGWAYTSRSLHINSPVIAQSRVIALV